MWEMREEQEKVNMDLQEVDSKSGKKRKRR